MESRRNIFFVSVQYCPPLFSPIQCLPVSIRIWGENLDFPLSTIPTVSFKFRQKVQFKATWMISTFWIWSNEIKGYLLRAGGCTISYVHSYQVRNTLLRINYLTCLVSTMASSGFGPYHGMSLDDAQTKCVGVIPTPCAMTHALGLVQFPPQHE